MSVWKQILICCVVLAVAVVGWARFFPGAGDVLERWGLDWAVAATKDPAGADGEGAGRQGRGGAAFGGSPLSRFFDIPDTRQVETQSVGSGTVGSVVVGSVVVGSVVCGVAAHSAPDRVADIAVPVRWWHGDAEHIIPLEHGQPARPAPQPPSEATAARPRAGGPARARREAAR